MIRPSRFFSNWYSSGNIHTAAQNDSEDDSMSDNVYIPVENQNRHSVPLGATETCIKVKNRRQNRPNKNRLTLEVWEPAYSYVCLNN